MVCNAVHQIKPTPSGVIVLDVVEGTALDSLSHMSSILAQRPSSFSSIQEALSWWRSAPGTSCHNTPHSAHSATLAIPPQLEMRRRRRRSDEIGAVRRKRIIQNIQSGGGGEEEEEKEEEGEEEDLRYYWRTNLVASKPFWEGWYKGLSNLFLSARCGKLLILAGTDRLDKPLMIGQVRKRCSE